MILKDRQAEVTSLRTKLKDKGLDPIPAALSEAMTKLESESVAKAKAG